MSISVIKEGKYSTTYVKTCTSCDAVFTFKICDLSYNVDVGKYYMLCPECGHREVYDTSLLEKYNPNRIVE